MSNAHNRARRCLSVPTIGLIALAFLACGIVPDAPSWEVGVAAPLSSDTVPLTDFLPATIGTTTVNGETFFTAPSLSGSVDLTLGTMCPPCIGLGVTAVIPSFDYFDSLDLRFPQELVELEIVNVGVSVTVTNNLQFNLLHSPDPDSGLIEMIVKDLGTQAELGRRLQDGSLGPLAPGGTLVLGVGLSDVTVTEGLRVILHTFSSERQLVSATTLDTSTTVAVRADVDTSRLAAVTVELDSIGLLEQFEHGFDVDQMTADDLAKRFVRAEVDLELLHNVEVDGPFEMSMAEDPSGLFSGDPTREAFNAQFTFTPNVVQNSAITLEEFQRLLGYDGFYVGYRAVGTGTRTNAQGRDKLARFSAETMFRTRLLLLIRLRVGS